MFRTVPNGVERQHTAVLAQSENCRWSRSKQADACTVPAEKIRAAAKKSATHEIANVLLVETRVGEIATCGCESESVKSAMFMGFSACSRFRPGVADGEQRTTGTVFLRVFPERCISKAPFATDNARLISEEVTHKADPCVSFGSDRATKRRRGTPSGRAPFAHAPANAMAAVSDAVCSTCLSSWWC